jgi:hypothetical protein
LWRNECDRVFCDRLTTAEDQKSYYEQLSGILKVLSSPPSGSTRTKDIPHCAAMS